MKKLILFSFLLIVGFIPASASAYVLYSQTDASVLDETNCTNDCNEFIGGKTHRETATTTQIWAITASSTLYASFYAGMNGSAYGEFLFQPKVYVNIEGCAFNGNISSTTLAETSLDSPVLFANIPLTVTSGSCTDVPEGTAWSWRIGEGNWNGEISSYTDGFSDSLNNYFVLTTEESDFENPETRIDYVIPENDIVISSSTPPVFNAFGYLSSNDADLDVRIRMKILKETQCTNVICAFQTIGLDFEEFFMSPIALEQGQAQGFNVSTTSTRIYPEGLYTLQTSIVKPTTYFGLSGLFGFSFGYDVLVSTTTQFSAGAFTTVDDVLRGIKNLSFTATSSEALMASCNPLSFGLADCMTALFAPDFQEISSVLDSTKRAFLTTAPWGYVTVLINDFNVATSTLPVISYTFPASSVFGSTTLAYNFNTIMTDSTTIINDLKSNTDNPQTVWDILMPIINIFMYLVLLFLIVNDLTHIHKNNKSEHL